MLNPCQFSKRTTHRIVSFQVFICSALWKKPTEPHYPLLSSLPAPYFPFFRMADGHIHHHRVTADSNAAMANGDQPMGHDMGHAMAFHFGTMETILFKWWMPDSGWGRPLLPFLPYSSLQECSSPVLLSC